VIIAAQSKLLDTAPYTIPGVPLGERPSSLLSTVPLIWLTGSDSPVIWIPIYPFRPYDPSLLITQSTLLPTKPTPGIDNIDSKRGRSNYRCPLFDPYPSFKFNTPVNPLVLNGRREGSSARRFWDVSFRKWGRYIPRDFGEDRYGWDLEVSRQAGW
jgi:hypothetical protein